MRSLKWKGLVLVMTAVFAVVSVTGYAEAAQKRSRQSRRNNSTPAKTQSKNVRAEKKAPAVVTSDDVIGEEMLKLADLFGNRLKRFKHSL